MESDPNIGHGWVGPVDADGNPVDEAMEGARVFLDVEPDNGYAIAAWNIVVGTNAIPTAGVWRFVPPTSGVYSFTLADSQDWELSIRDDWGCLVAEALVTDRLDAGLVQGSVYHAEFRNFGGGATTVTVARIDDVALYPVVIDAEHATVERLFADAPAGQPFPFTLVAAPGWAITNVVATAADGTELSLYDMDSHYVFDMPASAVTVRLELASDWVAFPSPDSGGPGGSSLQDDRLGNGFLVLRSTPRIPCRDDEWRASSLRIVDRLPDGHVVAEAALDPGASPLPARFFRPAITTFAR